MLTGTKDRCVLFVLHGSDRSLFLEGRYVAVSVMKKMTSALQYHDSFKLAA